VAAQSIRLAQTHGHSLTPLTNLEQKEGFLLFNKFCEYDQKQAKLRALHVQAMHLKLKQIHRKTSPQTMSYRKHGVRIESCFKETALKDVEGSIKLSRYR